MHRVTLVIDVILAAYIGWQVVEFVPRYRLLQVAVANGDERARVRLYQHALGFEWTSALLALLALGFDWSKLNPRLLGLNDMPLLRSLLQQGTFDRSKMGGIFFGLAIGTVGFVVARIRSNRQATVSGISPIAPRWRKLLPDFSALIPATTRERLLWVLVAVSAGICEEIVFRGWLLSSLHGPLKLNGTVLVAVAAGIFGLAHIYQQVTGVLLTTLAGVLFCALYVASGSLLVPMVIHVLVDARFAVLPTLRNREPQPALPANACVRDAS
jgi:membrane protease YdiL (CAAX protease family)